MSDYRYRAPPHRDGSTAEHHDDLRRLADLARLTGNRGLWTLAVQLGEMARRRRRR